MENSHREILQRIKYRLVLILRCLEPQRGVPLLMQVNEEHSVTSLGCGE